MKQRSDVASGDGRSGVSGAGSAVDGGARLCGVFRLKPGRGRSGGIFVERSGTGTANGVGGAEVAEGIVSATVMSCDVIVVQGVSMLEC
jgi:hypothetical protein